jgi:hypothetical protein
LHGFSKLLQKRPNFFILFAFLQKKSLSFFAFSFLSRFLFLPIRFRFASFRFCLTSHLLCGYASIKNRETKFLSISFLTQNKERTPEARTDPVQVECCDDLYGAVPPDALPLPVHRHRAGPGRGSGLPSGSSQ